MNAELQKKIGMLDLRTVKAKFLSRKSWWWKLRNSVEVIEGDYRRFLYLLGTSENVLVPWTQNLDDFWHEHILDTRKYAADCQNLFGKLIHHNPGLPKGTPNHTKASQATVEAYKTAFKASKPTAKKKDELAPKTTESSCSSGIETIGMIAASCSSAPSAPSCGSSSAASCSSGASCGSSGGDGGGGCGGGGCGGGGCGGGD